MQNRESTFELMRRLSDELAKAKQEQFLDKIKRCPSGTLHRRDLASCDFGVLVSFIRALTFIRPVTRIVMIDGEERVVEIHRTIDVGKQELRLPLWYKANGQWQEAGFKIYEKEAILVPLSIMRRIAKYMSIKESAIIRTLFKFSMISSFILHQNNQLLYRYRYSWKTSDIDFERIEVVIEGFMLDKERVDQWTTKVLNKYNFPGC